MNKKLKVVLLSVAAVVLMFLVFSFAASYTSFVVLKSS